MNSKLHILALVAMMMLAGCSVHRDRERIETAEALLYCNRDSTELLIRQVERPERRGVATSKDLCRRGGGRGRPRTKRRLQR